MIQAHPIRPLFFSCSSQLTLKDQLLRQLEGQLKKEKEDRERQQRYGLSPEELQSRLAWSQSDLAHTRSALQ